MAEKIFLKARDERLSGDQEQAFVLFMRFLAVAETVKKSEEYKTNKVSCPGDGLYTLRWLQAIPALIRAQMNWANVPGINVPGKYPGQMSRQISQANDPLEHMMHSVIPGTCEYFLCRGVALES